MLTAAEKQRIYREKQARTKQRVKVRAQEVIRTVSDGSGGKIDVSRLAKLGRIGRL